MMDFIDPQGRVRYRGTPFAEREPYQDVQPGGVERGTLGPGHRHLRRKAGRAVTTTDVGSDSKKKQPMWQRHRTASIAVAVVVVALIAVISDLPRRRPGRATSARRAA